MLTRKNWIIRRLEYLEYVSRMLKYFNSTPMKFNEWLGWITHSRVYETNYKNYDFYDRM